MRAFLGFFAKHGKLVLVAGLIAGVLMPGLAAAMKPWLPELVAALLFVAALRIGPKEALGNLEKFPSVIGLVLVYQIAVPLILVAFFSLFGLSGPVAFAIVLMTSASSISGAPNLVILTGNNPAPAMRLLIVGTALLPLTVLPVLWVVPEIGDARSVFATSGRLLLLIAVATCAAFAVRRLIFPSPDKSTIQAFDGLSAIAMSVVVIGLMSAIGPALNNNIPELLKTLVAACLINWGLQCAAFFAFKNKNWREERVSFSIVAGNRNMALFLAALPVTTTDPILLFIGCYQIPMYMTPIVMARLYNQAGSLNKTF